MSVIDYSKVKRIHFLGIAGTGMASVAGLCQQSGDIVTGSDGPIYPPMSTLLEQLKIRVFPSYAPENLAAVRPDLVVVGNALSRGNIELEAVLANGIPYTSFPALLGERVLPNRVPIVVTGTHGKTTTSTLMAHLLSRLGHQPGYFIGGVPKNLPQSFDLGKGPLFVLEGDEYDTAFFDKGSKFLHYRPQGLIINAIEFDHADIFANLEKIVEQFEKVIRLVPDPRLIAVNSDDPVVVGLMDRLGLSSKVIKVSPYSNSSSAGLRVAEYKPGGPGAAADPTSFTLETKCWGRLRVNTNLNGRYNAANIAHAVAVLQGLVETGFWTKAPGASALVEAIAEFSGVRRRLDHLGSVKGIDIFEDFAHHPTAVNHVIETMRASGVGRRLLVAFEPRNATGRRNTFEKEYAEVFRKADGVWIGECPLDKRIPEELRMNTLRLASAIGSHAAAFETNDQLVESLATAVKPGDMVVFMTSSSFSGAQHRITGMLKERFGG